jgi:hypothetical protein
MHWGMTSNGEGSFLDQRSCVKGPITAIGGRLATDPTSTTIAERSVTSRPERLRTPR